MHIQSPKTGGARAETINIETHAVWTSLQTHQNFEAATCYKSRNGKKVIEAKQAEHKPDNAYSSAEYKLHDNMPTESPLRAKRTKSKSKLKTNQSKAVRPSSRGNQNFEAATYLRSRNGKNVIQAKRIGYKTDNTYSSIGYKMHGNIPDVQAQRKRQTKNRPNFKTNQPKAVRHSSRGNQNFEAARCYKTRKGKNDKNDKKKNANNTSSRTRQMLSLIHI